MKRKILEIHEGKWHLECIKDNSVKVNPYRLYQVWWDQGWHRKQIVRYAEFESVMWHIGQMMGIARL